jgi:hypothetical protein
MRDVLADFYADPFGFILLLFVVAALLSLSMIPLSVNFLTLSLSSLAFLSLSSSFYTNLSS